MNLEALNSTIKDFNGVTPGEVLGFEYNKAGALKNIKVGDNILPEEDIKQLISEAQALKDSFLWSLLSVRLAHIAQLKSLTATT